MRDEMQQRRDTLASKIRSIRRCENSRVICHVGTKALPVGATWIACDLDTHRSYYAVPTA